MCRWKKPGRERFCQAFPVTAHASRRLLTLHLIYQSTTRRTSLVEDQALIRRKGGVEPRRLFMLVRLRCRRRRLRKAPAFQWTPLKRRTSAPRHASEPGAVASFFW